MQIGMLQIEIAVGIGIKEALFMFQGVLPIIDTIGSAFELFAQKVNCTRIDGFVMRCGNQQKTGVGGHPQRRIHNLRNPGVSRRLTTRLLFLSYWMGRNAILTDSPITSCIETRKSPGPKPRASSRLSVLSAIRSFHPKAAGIRLWSNGIERDCNNQNVFLAIRDNRFDLYHNGGKLFSYDRNGL